MKKPLMTLTDLRVSSFITHLNEDSTLKGGTNGSDYSGDTTAVCCTISNSGASLPDPNGVACELPVSVDGTLM